ncbi:hypothetical protein OIU74_001983 [Salix koriyanagi]|uniref:Uncharacterized protein n=1 Tax=Salix koriyanagi TaxID=2511006 RepID=A0A9Q0X2K6_9ROSI|nr:hypothetical protein OIU74_001983 [Salix koriyanagi]
MHALCSKLLHSHSSLSFELTRSLRFLSQVSLVAFQARIVVSRTNRKCVGLFACPFRVCR